MTKFSLKIDWFPGTEGEGGQLRDLSESAAKLLM